MIDNKKLLQDIVAQYEAQIDMLFEHVKEWKKKECILMEQFQKGNLSALYEAAYEEGLNLNDYKCR